MDSKGSQQPMQRKFRSACDICHKGKIKCSGGSPCEGCHKLGVVCRYSVANRIGSPKGVRNKKTLDRIKNLKAADQTRSTVERRSEEQSVLPP